MSSRIVGEEMEEIKLRWNKRDNCAKGKWIHSRQEKDCVEELESDHRDGSGQSFVYVVYKYAQSSLVCQLYEYANFYI